MTLDERKNYLITTFYNLRTKGIVTTWTSFAEKIGVNRGTLSSAKNGDEHYLTDSLIFKVREFAEGHANGAISINGSQNNVATHNAVIHSHIGAQESAIDYGEPSETEMVPVIPMKIYKDPEVAVLDYIESSKAKDIEYTPAVQQFPPTTCFKICNSDAMVPYLRPGDQLALAAIGPNSTIVNGEIYAVDSEDVGLVTRYLYDEGDHFILHASNSHYRDFKLKKEGVYTVFRVLGLIRSIL